VQTDFLSWYWWISVVGVGLFINLISAYVKPPIDQLLGRYSEQWKQKLLARRKSYGTEINLLLNDPSMIVLVVFRQMQAENRSICFFFVTSFVMFVFLLSKKTMNETDYLIGCGFMILFAGLASYFSWRSLTLGQLLREIYVIGRFTPSATATCAS